MRGSNVIRIQQSRGRSFVGGTGIGCLPKNCGTEDAGALELHGSSS
jgi:hypothetical protein